jgi:hypothetical protein
VIEQTLYGNHREMLITPDFPIVGKVGHAHAGNPLHHDDAYAATTRPQSAPCPTRKTRCMCGVDY